MKTNKHFFIIFRPALFRMRNVSDKSFRKKIKTRLVFNGFSFRKPCRFLDNMETFCRAKKNTDDNMADAHCMLDTYGYKYTLGICNTYCTSTATMASQTRFNVTFYIYCLPCCICFPHRSTTACCYTIMNISNIICSVPAVTNDVVRTGISEFISVYLSSTHLSSSCSYLPINVPVFLNSQI